MTNKIVETIKKIVGEKVKFSVAASEKPEFGHYSTNVAFAVGGDPQKLADEILRQAPDFFEKVEVAGRFINFWISKSALIEELSALLRNTKKYEYTKKKEKINLEFVSANPTGPLTMANGRGGFYGDVLANVLEEAGHKVTREYYINDAGNQIKLLGESIALSLGKAPLKEEHYKGEYIKTLAQRLKSKLQNPNYQADSEEVGRWAAKELLKEIKKSLTNVGIKFDVWFSEYEELRGGDPSTGSGLINKILKLLEKNDLLIKKEGAVWLKTSDIADEKDRVLVKSNGEPTYFLVDLAYHYNKLIKRKFDKAIDIWGADHHGYVKRLESGIKELGIRPDRLKIIIMQLVRLVEAGKEAKMSKRAGEFITLDDLIKEVGKDAARFFFLMHSPGTHMDFDLALAKEKSPKNPVYYAQYAFVRCNSILKKSKLQNFSLREMPRRDTNYKQITKSKFQTESELNLVRELIKLPDVVMQTAEDCQVSRLARYAMEVARAVHNFYEKERVIDKSGGVSEPRLALVSAAKNILERLFKILGIAAPDKM